MKTTEINEIKRRISIYTKILDIVSRNMSHWNFVCNIARRLGLYPEEYLLFKEVPDYSWLVKQLYPVCEMEERQINEYRIFMLQLCIEMLKSELPKKSKKHK